MSNENIAATVHNDLQFISCLYCGLSVIGVSVVGSRFSAFGMHSGHWVNLDITSEQGTHAVILTADSAGLTTGPVIEVSGPDSAFVVTTPLSRLNSGPLSSLKTGPELRRVRTRIWSAGDRCRLSLFRETFPPRRERHSHQSCRGSRPWNLDLRTGAPRLCSGTRRIHSSYHREPRPPIRRFYACRNNAHFMSPRFSRFLGWPRATRFPAHAL
jgi:hypothetical protein